MQEGKTPVLQILQIQRFNILYVVVLQGKILRYAVQLLVCVALEIVYPEI